MHNLYSSNLKISIMAMIVFIVSFVLLFFCMDRTINIYDEGVILTGAMRVGAGDIPHRDFYANYGPASFYLLSWLFDIFGQKVIVERVFDLSVRSAILAIVYASLVSNSKQLIAITVTIVCALWLCSVGNYAYPIYPVILLSIISSGIMLNVFLRDTSIFYPFAAGMITGLAALFRYDLGFFIFIAHLSSAALIISLSHSDTCPKSVVFFKKIGPYVLAAGFTVFLILLWYYSVGAISSFVHDVIIFPAEFYGRTRNLPFPSFFEKSTLKLGGIYLPIIICLAVMLNFCAKDFKFKDCLQSSSTEDDSRKNYIAFLVTFTIITAIFYIKGLVRVSLEHMQLALLPSLMILGVLLGRRINKSKCFRLALAGIGVFSLVTSLTSAADYLERHIKDNVLVISHVSGFFKLLLSSDLSSIDDNTEISSIDPKQLYSFFVDRDREAAIHFIAQNTNPTDRIFVGLTRHDKVFANDVSSYFIAKRLPATKWHHFDPGIQTSSEVQSQMINDFYQNKPRYIWLESTFNDVNEPNDSAKSSGIRILDEYINVRNISVLSRKSD